MDPFPFIPRPCIFTECTVASSIRRTQRDSGYRARETELDNIDLLTLQCLLTHPHIRHLHLTRKMGSFNIVIEAASPDDIPKLAAINASAYYPDPFFHTAWPDEATMVPFYTKRLAARFATPDTTVWMAKDEHGRVIGFVALTLVDAKPVEDSQAPSVSQQALGAGTPVGLDMNMVQDVQAAVGLMMRRITEKHYCEPLTSCGEGSLRGLTCGLESLTLSGPIGIRGLTLCPTTRRWYSPAATMYLDVRFQEDPDMARFPARLVPLVRQIWIRGPGQYGHGPLKVCEVGRK